MAAILTILLRIDRTNFTLFKQWWQAKKTFLLRLSGRGIGQCFLPPPLDISANLLLKGLFGRKCALRIWAYNRTAAPLLFHSLTLFILLFDWFLPQTECTSSTNHSKTFCCNYSHTDFASVVVCDDTCYFSHVKSSDLIRFDVTLYFTRNKNVAR